MHPQIQLPEEGQCPICFMDLIEVAKESSENWQSLRQISFAELSKAVHANNVGILKWLVQTAQPLSPCKKT